MAMSDTLEAFIVEDSPLIREQLALMLEDLTNVKVIGFADNESDAAAALAGSATSATLVVVDIFLRQGSGLSLLRNEGLRRDGRCFVVLTNDATSDIRNEALRLGAERVFDKSRQIDELVRYCEEMGGRSRGGG